MLIRTSALQGVTFRVHFRVPGMPKSFEGFGSKEVHPSSQVHSISGVPVTIKTGEKELPDVVNSIVSATWIKGGSVSHDAIMETMKAAKKTPMRERNLQNNDIRYIC